MFIVNLDWSGEEKFMRGNKKEKDLPSDMPSAWFLMYRVKHGGHETTLLVFPIFRLTFGNLVKL